MIKRELLRTWKRDEKAPFKGWDFSYLKKRYIEEQPPWNYKLLAKKLIRKSNFVLDIATGGGEIFSEVLKVSKPKKAVAIEGYKPNVKIAKNNLKKYGVKVIYAHESKELPFQNKEFDLVLNRHGGLNIKEISRIIKSKGIFVTQQVDARNLEDLMNIFGTTSKWKSNILSNVKKCLTAAGFKVLTAKEWKGKVIFYDIGALVYFLKAVPWVVNDFSVDKYILILEKLQHKLSNKRKLEFTIRRFLILAQKK